MAEKSKYAKAGVNIKRADRAKSKLADIVRGTFNKNVVGDFGGFGAAFSIAGISRDSVLISSADGVGTKLKLAFMTGRNDTVGHDLVNHLVNDILCMGAKPLFFLDYIGMGKMDEAVVSSIVKGISAGCMENDCALLGGETAEMPGFYSDDEYDLAGFIVGAAKKSAFPNKENLKEGDVMIGFSSSGLHTNGYSLARHAFFDIANMSPKSILPETGNALGDELLTVHRSYLKTVYPYMEDGTFKAAAHITGGGFEGNIARILPANLDAIVDSTYWWPPKIYRAIQRLAKVDRKEMYRVFNMGIGMVAVLAEKDIPYVKKTMRNPNCEVVPVGVLTKGTGKVVIKL